MGVGSHAQHVLAPDPWPETMYVAPYSPMPVPKARTRSSFAAGGVPARVCGPAPKVSLGKPPFEEGLPRGTLRPARPNPSAQQADAG